MHPPPQTIDVAPRGAPPRPDVENALIRQLRRSARLGQLAPRFDLDRLAAGTDGDPDLWGAALLQAAGSERPIRLHRAPATAASDAECWLSRLVACVRAGDSDSARFLAERRVPKRDRRLALLFAQRLAAALDAGHAADAPHVALESAHRPCRSRRAETRAAFADRLSAQSM